MLNNIANPNEETFSDYLISQLHEKRHSEKILYICQYIILNLNDKGWLDLSLDEIADALHVSVARANEGLAIVQSLDPKGVAARDFRECLILQIDPKLPHAELLKKLILNGLELVGTDDCQSISELMNCDLPTAKMLAKTIRKMNPFPSTGFSNGEDIKYIVPDAILDCTDGTITININSTDIPTPILSESYNAMIADKTDQNAVTFLRQKKHEALQLIHAYSRRQQTLTKVLEAIVSKQSQFFIAGAELRAMGQKDIAQDLHMSISTVSRSISGKYIQCAYGTIPLKSLFSYSLPTSNGNTVSSQEVKKRIRKIILNEDKTKPWTDEEIREILEADAITISRRTVMKYRCELSFKSSRERKK